MQNLIQFLLRSGAFFVFIGLELICFVLIIRNNEHQRQQYFQYSSSVTGRLSERFESFVDYWSLREMNDSLMQENARLHNELLREALEYPDSTRPQLLDPYHVVAARVIKNSVNSRNNYIVLDQGSNAGVRKGMGVIHDSGPVGIIIATSARFSKAISLLHSESMISASIERNNYFGSLVWRSANPQRMRLDAIPKHADVQVGDTIVTSGQSAVFPRGVVIGTVDTMWVEKGSSFYSIDVDLNVDISKLDHVYVLEYRWAHELDSLEQIQ